MKGGVELPGSVHMQVAPALRLTLAALLPASCGGVGRDPGSQDDTGEPPPEQGPTVPRGSATFEELTRRADAYYGERVAVSGEAGRTTSPNVPRRPATSDESSKAALMAGDGATVPDLSGGRRVRVTGGARRFDVGEVGRKPGVESDDSPRAGFEAKPKVAPETVGRSQAERRPDRKRSKK